MMRQERLRVSFALLLTAALGGCASKHLNLLDELPFAAEAIRLKFRADTMLNFYENNASTLIVCLYQLKDATVFSETAKTKEGVVRLLACNNPIGEAVTTFQRIIVHPGEVRVVSMDRQKSTAFVGVIAGYFDSTPDKMTRLYEIPITTYEEGFLVWKDHYRRPNALTVEMTLDPKGIRVVDAIPLTNMTNRNRGLPEAKSGIPEAKNGLPEEKSDLPEAKSGLPEAKSDLPEASKEEKQSNEAIPE